VAFWAIAAGWAFLFGYLAARRRLRHLADFDWRGWVILALMGFFGWAGYAGSLNVALARLPVPEAIVINYLHPVFTVLFQGAWFAVIVRPVSRWEDGGDQRHRPRAVSLAAGMGCCLLGVVVIATHGQLGALGHMASAVGAAAALFAAFAWGIYSNLGRFVAVRPHRGDRVAADVQTFAAMTFGLAMLAAALVAGRMLVPPSGWQAQFLLPGSRPVGVSAWQLAGVMGLALYCIGFTAWLAALDSGRQAGAPHRLPPLTYITPILGILLARVLLNEPLGPGFWQGAALIAAGNAVIALGQGQSGVRGAAGHRRMPRPTAA
jgi:drug/metabolite transporter (DMT)-like permease